MSEYTSDPTLLEAPCLSDGEGVGFSPPDVPTAPTLAKQCVPPAIIVTSPALPDGALLIEIERSNDGGASWQVVHAFEAAGNWSDTGVLPATEYSYRARACNDVGCSAGSTSAVLAIESETLVVTWLQPAENSNLRDVTELQIQLADSGESARPECDDEPVVFQTYFNGDLFALEWKLISGTWRNGIYQASWDAREFGAGAANLLVVANGTDGCPGGAARDFILQGIFNPLAVCWWSKILPTPALDVAWPRANSQGQARSYKRITPSIINPVRASDDADNYVYTLAVNSPGTSTDIADYQPLQDKRGSLLLESGQTFRVAMCREPLLQRAQYALGALRGVRLHSYQIGESKKLGVLTQSPGKVLSFDGGVLSLISDLSAFADFTPVDFAFLDNRFYVVMQPVAGAPASALPHIRVVDLDSTDAPYRLLPDENNSPLTAIAVFDSKLWIAATTGEEAKIYSFGSGDLQPVEVASTPPVVRFDTRNGQTPKLRATCIGGAVYEIAGTGATLVYDTNQATAQGLFGDGAVIYAGTGNTGKLFANRGGAWHEEKDFAELSGVLALASYRSTAHVGGDSPRLYQRRAGVWIQVDSLANTSSINDMAEFGDALVMATSNGGSSAFLHTRIISSKKGVIAREVPSVTFGLELGD